MNQWHERATCNGFDPALFDLDSWVKRALEQGQEERFLDVDDLAGLICDGCPVARECAADAMNPPAWETVRAGIPLIQLTPRSKSDLMVKALKHVAAGLPTDEARARLLTQLRALANDRGRVENKGGGVDV